MPFKRRRLSIPLQAKTQSIRHYTRSNKARHIQSFTLHIHLHGRFYLLVNTYTTSIGTPECKQTHVVTLIDADTSRSTVNYIRNAVLAAKSTQKADEPANKECRRLIDRTI